MAWSWGDSFDLYTAATDLATGYWDALAGAPSFVAGRFGGQAFSMNSSSVGVNKSSGQNDAVHHIVVAFKSTAAISGTSNGCLLQLLDGTSPQCTIVFRSDGAILLQTGTLGGTTVATYTGAVTAANVWYAFEFEITVHNSAGTFAVRKNGSTSNDFSATSLNTRGGTANAYANKLAVGMGTILSTHVVDDLFWQSSAATGTWLGDIRCYTRYPASDSSVQFSRPSPVAITSAIASTLSDVANDARFIAFTATFTGTIGTAILYANAGATANVKTTIYDNTAANVAGLPLGSANVLVNPVAGANTVTWASPVAVTAGTTYWLATDVDATVVWVTGNSANGSKATITYASFPTNNPTINASNASLRYIINITPSFNYQFVNETTQDTTTSYVYDSTAGHADFYGLATATSTPSTVVAVTTRGYMSKSDAGTRSAAVQMKSGATTVASTTLGLGSDFGWFWRTDTVDPNTSATWTASAVNSITVGPTVIA